MGKSGKMTNLAHLMLSTRVIRLPCRSSCCLHDSIVIMFEAIYFFGLEGSVLHAHYITSAALHAYSTIEARISPMVATVDIESAKVQDVQWKIDDLLCTARSLSSTVLVVLVSLHSSSCGLAVSELEACEAVDVVAELAYAVLENKDPESGLVEMLAGKLDMVLHEAFVEVRVASLITPKNCNLLYLLVVNCATCLMTTLRHAHTTGISSTDICACNLEVCKAQGCNIETPAHRSCLATRHCLYAQSTQQPP